MKNENGVAVLGIIIIIAGILLLIQRLGINIPELGFITANWWPLLLIGFGLMVILPSVGGLIILGLIVLALMAGIGGWRPRVDRNVIRNEIKSEVRTINSFNKIELRGGARVEIEESNESYVRIEGINTSQVTTRIENGKLIIDQTSRWRQGLGNVGGTFYIGTIALEDIKIEGAAEVVSRIEGERLKVGIDGAGSLKMENEYKEVEVEINGAGSAKVRAKDTLKATINGVGNIEYYGNPKLIESINGLGKITRITE